MTLLVYVSVVASAIAYYLPYQASAWGIQLAAQMIVGAAINYTMGKVRHALRDEPKKQGGEMAGRKRMVRESAEPRRIIYGRAQVSGPMVLVNTEEQEDGPDILHIVVPVAGHEVEEFEKIKFDEDELDFIYDEDGEPIGKYHGNVKVRVHHGKEHQQADDYMVNNIKEWTDQHRGRNVAYIYAELEYDRDLFSGGIPTITATVKGKNDIYDPRNKSTGYTDNPALCVADYVTDDRLGMGADWDEIEEETLMESANVCEETVNGAQRYTTNGTVKTSSRHDKTIKQLTASMMGDFYHSNGEFHILSGHFRSSTDKIEMDDIVGEVNLISKESKSEKYNSVRGTYISEEHSWEETDFPQRSIDEFVQEDGEKLWRDLRFPFTIYSEEVQRMGDNYLRLSRLEERIELTCGLSMLNTQPGDTVEFHFEPLNYDGELFQIDSWDFTMRSESSGAGDNESPPALAIKMTLKKTDPGAYKDITPETRTITSPAVYTGEDDYIDYGDVLDQTGSFTFEGWVRCQNLNVDDQILIAKDDSDRGWGLYLSDASGGIMNFYSRQMEPLNLHTSSFLKLDNWTHIAAVWDSSDNDFRFYVNGGLLNEFSINSGGVEANTANLFIGGGTGLPFGNSWRGALDDLRLWGDIRTQTEIRKNMTTTVPADSDNLLANWRMNSGSGTTIIDSANDYDGTLNGGEWDYRGLTIVSPFTTASQQNGQDIRKPADNQITNAREVRQMRKLFEGEIDLQAGNQGTVYPGENTVDTPDDIMDGASAYLPDGRFYLIGGDIDGSGETDKVQYYKLENNTFHTVSSINYPRSGIASAVVAGEIYICGGENLSNSDYYLPNSERYNQSNDSWETLPDPPYPMNSAQAVEEDDEFWVIGGNTEGSGDTLKTVDSFSTNYTISGLEYRDGSLWSISSDNELLEISPEDGSVIESQSIDYSNTIVDLAYDGSNWWVLDSTDNKAVKLDSEMAPEITYQDAGYEHGIGYHNGNLYVSSGTNDEVYEIDPADGSLVRTLTSMFGAEGGLAFDEFGNMYVGDESTTSIERIELSSDTRKNTVSTTDSYGIAVDKGDDYGLWVQYSPNSNIRRVQRVGQTNKIISFDPTTGGWSDTGIKLPVATANGTAIQYENKIIIIGGENENRGVHSKVQIYNTTTSRWNIATDYPHSPGVRYITGAEYDGAVYLPHGHDGNNEIQTFYSYDISNDSWGIEPTIDASRSEGNAPYNYYLAIDDEGSLCQMAGHSFGALNSVALFDCNLGSWYLVPDESETPEVASDAVDAGDEVFIATGWFIHVYSRTLDRVTLLWSSGIPNMSADDGCLAYDEQRNNLHVLEHWGVHEAIDLETYTEIQASDTNNQITNFDGVFHNGLFYVVGGRDTDTGDELDTLRVYDPDADSWSILSSLPEARQDHAFEELNGILYCLGGSGPTDNTKDTTYIYNPVEDTWTTGTSLPAPRQFLRSTNYNDRIWIYGGDAVGGTSNDNLWSYSPETQWETHASGPITNTLGEPVPIVNFDDRLLIFGENGDFYSYLTGYGEQEIYSGNFPMDISLAENTNNLDVNVDRGNGQTVTITSLDENVATSEPRVWIGNQWSSASGRLIVVG